MGINIDASRHLKHSASCCEILYNAESYLLEGSPWHLDITFQRWNLSSISLEVFADVDYASKATDRRSVLGVAVMCGGASVCWFSRTQKCVTFSTSEAEYVALGDAVKELLLLRQVWRFMLLGKVMPCFPVVEDNQGAVQLAQNPLANSNSKHIGVRHHFLRELVCQRDINVVQVPSKF